MNIEFFKKHPMGSAIAAVFVFVLVYYLSSKGSSGSAAAASTADPTLAIAQLNAAQNQQNAQIGAQLQAAQLSADVQNTQTTLQAQVANNQIAAQANATAQGNAAQVALANIATNGQVTINDSNNKVLLTQLTDNAAVQTTQLNDVLAGQMNDNATKLAAVTSQFGYLNNVAGLQAGVATSQIQAQSTAIATAQKNQYDLSQSIINHVTDVNGSQNRTQILETAAGYPGAAAANAASTGGAYPSAAAGIINSIGAAGSNVLQTLFL